MHWRRASTRGVHRRTRPDRRRPHPQRGRGRAGPRPCRRPRRARRRFAPASPPRQHGHARDQPPAGPGARRCVGARQHPRDRARPVDPDRARRAAAAAWTAARDGADARRCPRAPRRPAVGCDPGPAPRSDYRRPQRVLGRRAPAADLRPWSVDTPAIVDHHSRQPWLIEVHLSAPGDEAADLDARLETAVSAARRATRRRRVSVDGRGLEQAVGDALVAPMAHRSRRVVHRRADHLTADRCPRQQRLRRPWRGRLQQRRQVELLAVPPALLEAHGAVSEPVALAMASGLRAASGVDLAVARRVLPGLEAAPRKSRSAWCASHSTDRSDRRSALGVLPVIARS